MLYYLNYVKLHVYIMKLFKYLRTFNSARTAPAFGILESSTHWVSSFDDSWDITFSGVSNVAFSNNAFPCKEKMAFMCKAEDCFLKMSV